MTDAWLKRLLENISQPGNLINDEFLQPWLVCEYVKSHPVEAHTFSAEFLIGRTLEYELELRCQKLHLVQADSKKWLEAICLKALYFHRFPNQHVYREPPSIQSLVWILADPDQLAKLMPGHEPNAEQLAGFQSFWQSVFDLGKGIRSIDSTLYAVHTRAVTRFAEWLELRQAAATAPPANILLDIAPTAVKQRASTSDSAPKRKKSAADSAVKRKKSRSVPAVGRKASKTVKAPQFPVLADLQSVLERSHTTMVAYAMPRLLFRAVNMPDYSPDVPALIDLLQDYPIIILCGSTGTGKTTLVAQSLAAAARQAGLFLIPVSLTEYCRSGCRDGLADVIGSLYPDAAIRGRLAIEFATALRERRVILCLDGYDELLESERAMIVREVNRLDRFILVTRKQLPTLDHRIDAMIQIDKIGEADALMYAEAQYSRTARERFEQWLQTDTDGQVVLERGLLLDVTCQIASEPTAAITLHGILDRALSRLLAHARHDSAEWDLPQRVVTALGELALVTLLARNQDRPWMDRTQVLRAWRQNADSPGEAFLDFVTTSGILLNNGDQFEFCSELLRDVLLAQFMDSRHVTLTARCLNPRLERVFALWANRLLQAGQVQRIVDVVTEIMRIDGDPYDARWSVVTRILEQCRGIEYAALQRLQCDVRQALLDFWHCASSNRMKDRIRSYFLRLGFDDLPPAVADDLEPVILDLEIATPNLDLGQVLSRSGHSDLMKDLAREPAKDGRNVTHALVDILACGDEQLVRAAAAFLTTRNLRPARWDRLSGGAAIDRLAEFAETHPADSYSSPELHCRARLAQSAALAVLARPEVLSDPTLLDRIPHSVIHTIMAICNLRIQIDEKFITIITSDGHECTSRGNSR